jgi:hypothetical protein
MLIMALGVILLFVSGLMLSRRGTPYNTVVVTAHKVLALGSVVLLALAFATSLASAPPEWPGWALSAVTAASVVALFASGALLSRSRPPAPNWRRIHRVAPYILLSAGLALVLLTSGSLN